MTEALTLTPQMMVVLGLLAFTIFLFVSEIVPVDVAAIIVMVYSGPKRLGRMGGVAKPD